MVRKKHIESSTYRYTRHMAQAEGMRKTQLASDLHKMGSFLQQGSWGYEPGKLVGNNVVLDPVAEHHPHLNVDALSLKLANKSGNALPGYPVYSLPLGIVPQPVPALRDRHGRPHTSITPWPKARSLDMP